MNLPIELKILDALSVVTDNNVSGLALALKQALDMTATSNPANALQLNQIIAGSVCQNWTTFNELASFTAQCLTRGDKQNITHAVQQFERIALESTR